MSDFDNYEEYENDLGLGDDDRKQAKSNADVEWYKGEKGRTDRAAIVYFHPVDVAAVTAARKKDKSTPKDELVKIGQKALADRAASLGTTVDQLTAVQKLDLTQVHFKSFRSHYEEGMGYFLSRLGKDGPEADAVWKRLSSEPKLNFSTMLVIYPTTKDGTLDKSRFSEITVKPWRFSQKRYEAIWKTNNTLAQNGLSIANQDLLLECKDPKFQQIEASGAGPAIWLKSEKYKETVLEKAVSLYDKLVPFREMSTDQLRSKLGLNGSAVQDVTGGGDFEDLLQNV
jgi:hypothetical protein